MMHMRIWNDINILEERQCRKQREPKEAAHILLSPEYLSQTNAELNPMWLPDLLKRGE